MMLTPSWQHRLKWPFTFLLLVVALIVGYSAWQWYFLEGGSYNAIFNVALALLTALLIPIVIVLWRTGPSQTAPEQLTPDALQNPRNRENLLNSVQTAWIDGVLRQSIHGEIIKLYLTHKPHAVGQRPWGLALKQAGKEDQPLPADYDLRQIFAESGCNLLILGQPGSGKTFTLLQVAQSLLTEARRDPAAPLPIILNLSSWAQERRPLADWLVEELFIQYGVARRVTRAGIAHNQFLYLLDGLDEVSAVARDDCVAAINAFKGEHPTEMVICSRSEEYGALQEQLRMGTAVEVQPLTPDQIDHYLNQEGLQLQAVRTTLKTDPDLRELAETPLMLSLMTLAYQGEDKIDLRPRAGKEARRNHIFDHYIANNFERRPLPADSLYSQAQAETWLSNLARGMVEHEQSVFYIEKLQPTWLGDGRWRRYYRLLIGLSGGLISGLIFGLIFGLVGGLIFGLGDGLIGGLASGLVVGGFLGLYYTLLLGSRSILVVEVLNWRILSWQNLWAETRKNLIFGLFGLFFGLIFALIVLKRGLIYGLFSGLFYGSFLLLITVMAKLLPRLAHAQETPQPMHPNEGVRHSTWNGLRMGLIYWLFWGLILGLLDAMSTQPKGWLVYGVFSGLLFGLMFGLSGYGGEVMVQHYSLRWLLVQAGVLPYPFRDSRLIAYLDAMQDRILLRRVGGGWMFVHRSLLEHFADLKRDYQ
jgi:hypothetical protein